jgi:hypothetical protein
MRKPKSVKAEWELMQETSGLSNYYLGCKVRMHKAALRLDKHREPGSYIK